MIFAIKPFEIHDGDGIRTTVFFKGCPLSCRWCHNPESLGFEREMLFDRALCVDCMRCTTLCEANVMQDGKHVFLREKCTLCGACVAACPKRAFEIAGEERSAASIAEEVLRDELFFKGSGGGVTFSGGEPLMQAELCAEIAAILKQRDIHIAVDTSGLVSRAALERMIPYTDTFLWDVKAIDEAVHIACTGVSNRTILDNLRYVDSLGIPIEIRYPYVPGMNDGEVERIAAFVRELSSVKRVRILPYHNFAARKYACLGQTYALNDTRLPTADELDRAVETMRQMGVTTVEHN